MQLEYPITLKGGRDIEIMVLLEVAEEAEVSLTLDLVAGFQEYQSDSADNFSPSSPEAPLYL